ncbi:MAG: hypothetical protein KIT84_14640 [Labilithrix sp.]|nr:hypothetical protein [Labilithrix sp.]MCW5812259.1 hypothetical protein [Labilithrix sp.]
MARAQHLFTAVVLDAAAFSAQVMPIGSVVHASACTSASASTLASATGEPSSDASVGVGRIAPSSPVAAGAAFVSFQFPADAGRCRFVRMSRSGASELGAPLPLIQNLSPVASAPRDVQDFRSAGTRLVALDALGGKTRVLAWSDPSKPPLSVCEVDGLATRLIAAPRTNQVIALIAPEWPFLANGKALGASADEGHAATMLKLQAMERLGSSAYLLLVDLESGKTRTIVESTAKFELADVVAEPGGASLAISGSRKVSGRSAGSSEWVWATRVIDLENGATVAEHALPDEALCPHSWSSDGLLLYSRVGRHPNRRGSFGFAAARSRRPRQRA